MSDPTYERVLLPAAALEPGQWTDMTPMGSPVLSCADCGGLVEIPDTHRIEDSGLIVPALKCPYVSCGTYVYRKLANYRDEVLT